MPSNTRHTLSLDANSRPEAQGLRGFARLHAVAAAVVLCTGLANMGEAHALALGRIVVQSALGEPLKAEIDVPDISTEEAASLRVGLASSDAFRAAGMDFNPTLSSLQITLQRRPNGSAYLRLSSARPVNEPFVDIIVEAHWASGRIVRDYTLLLDPTPMRASAPLATLPAAVAAPAAPAPTPAPTPAPAPTQAAASPAPSPVAPPPAVRPPAPPAAPPAPPAAPPRPPAAPAAQPAPAAEAPNTQLVVRNGETAGRIAANNRAPNVSLDQMLVALLRANPNAFISGNVNLIKAGSVLALPSESSASSISPQEARQVLVAQSRDFNEYRRRLAETVPTASVSAADRQTSGRIQTEVQEPKPAAPAQDKLTLSKGAASTANAAEARIAQERQAREASARVAELSKNINDLAKLGANTPAAAPAAANTPAAASKPAAAAPGIAVPAAPALTAPAAPPAPTPATATPPAAAPAAASATTPPAATPPATGEASPAANPAAPAPADAAAAPATPPVTPPVTPPITPPVVKPAPAPVQAPPPEEPSLLDDLLDNPLVLPAAGGLLALLAGFAFLRFRKRKQDQGVDSSFMESRLQPDSFFGNSGGQRVDTADSSLSDSSLVYSPSQLDAAGDVDPVAEADVYLAYGRDIKAEEILKEALRSTPQRVAIHSKLLNIYAKRRDVKTFESVASDVYDLTMGQGPEWDQACALGRDLDPTNSLYEPGGRRTAKASMAPTPKASAAPTAAPSSSKPATPSNPPTVAMAASPTPSAGPSTLSPLSLDLDLDFSMDEPAPPKKPAPAPAPAPVAAPSAADTKRSNDALSPASAAPAPLASIPFDMDFSLDTASGGLSTPAKPSPAPAPASAPSFQASSALPDLDLDDLPHFELPNKKQNPPPAAPPSTQNSAFDTHAEMLSFDLSDLSTASPPAASTPKAEEASAPGEDNPLVTKLALAEEFRSIGFMDGARSLAEEVLAEATGTLKTKASKFLADLN